MQCIYPLDKLSHINKIIGCFFLSVNAPYLLDNKNPEFIAL